MLNPLKYLKKLIKTSNQKELDRIQKKLILVNNLENQVKELKSLLDKTRKSESKKYDVLERKYLSAKGINVALERQLMFRNQQVELRKAKSSSSSRITM